MTVVGLFKVMPDVIDVGRDIWKKLKSPEELAIGKAREGVFGKDYYSDKYKFKISVPDDSWQFWKPTPQFLTGFLGGVFTLPTRDVPIVALSKHAIKMFRPNVVVTVEDVGSFTSISEIVSFTRELLIEQDFEIRDEDVHIYENTNSGILIGSHPYLRATMFQVQKIHLHEGRTYSVTASYVPISEGSIVLFGGLQEIMNSFQFIS